MAAVTENDGQSIASRDGSENDGELDGIPGADIDFGPIEMFNSNALPATFSSSAAQAVMTEDAPQPQSPNLPKRTRKRRSSADGALTNSGAVERGLSPEESQGAMEGGDQQQEPSSKDRRKSKKRKKTKDFEDSGNQPDEPESMETRMETPADSPQDQLHSEAAAASSVSESPKKRKSPTAVDGKRRKKAKPTFFEAPLPDIAEDDDDAYGELPSPSAMTPKARNRTKRAARKESRGRKPRKQRLSQSMRGNPEDDDADEPYGRPRGERKNRLLGYTQGRFSDAELARIARAVENFRANHSLTQQEVNELLHKPGGTAAGETNAQLWAQIFAECPDRHRQKVINITRKKFHNFVARGTWTPSQDAELAELINVHGTKWSKIAGMINRHPEDLRDRYRNYIVCGANQRKDAWDDPEEARLTQYVMDSMQAIDELRSNEPTRALLKKSYEELIDWQDISERMGRTRSRLQCITKWKSMNLRTNGKDRLVSSQADAQISFRLEKARRQIKSMPGEERLRLVLAIRATAAGTDVKIPWTKLVDKMFRNKWHRNTQMLLWRRLRNQVSNSEGLSVRDVAQQLVDYYNHEGELPEVPDEQYDDTDEMQFLQVVTPEPALKTADGEGQEPISEEFVRDSGGEDETAQANGEADGDAAAQSILQAQSQEEQVEEELSIDPALHEATSLIEKPTPAKRTANKATTPRKSRARQQPAVSQTTEPQEEEGDEEAATAAAAAAAAAATAAVATEVASSMMGTQDSEANGDKPRKRKKKQPKQKQPPPSAARAVERGPSAERSDSVMDDLEDLPARVTA